jgi:hypothetical protein
MYPPVGFVPEEMQAPPPQPRDHTRSATEPGPVKISLLPGNSRGHLGRRQYRLADPLLGISLRQTSTNTR